jgi:hypothetical protein
MLRARSVSRALASSSAAAALLAMSAGPSPPVQAQEPAAAVPGHRWVVSATVYAWAFSLDGKAGIRGRDVDIDVSFGDILEDLSVAAMGTVAARKGRYGFYVSPLFGRVESDAEIGPLEFRGRNDTTFLGFGGL